jgi:DNA adenine methylase
MKTPITYYGGKQSLAKLILSLIPPHHLYCEPFAGGLAVFFAKEKSPVEVVNDKDWRVVNFFKVLKTKYEELNKLIQETPHSRACHEKAAHVLQNPLIFSDVERAWALWVQCNQSYGSAIGAGFAYARKKNSCELRLMNKRLNFSPELSKRLDVVQIESTDAIRVIESRDTETSFFYVDPPYYNANMGHYGGYTADDFKALLECLSNIKGKFLLSSYPSEMLSGYVKNMKWKTLELDLALPMSAKTDLKGNLCRKRKTEVLTANYKI